MVGQRHRRPHPTRRVQCDAVRRTVEPVGEDPPPGQPTATVDVVRGQSPPDRLGDDQGAAIRCDRHAVGEVEVLGHHSDRVVGVEPGDDAALACLRADIGPAGGVYHHVTEIRRRDPGQVSALGDRVAVIAQHHPPLGRYDQQRAVGTETQASGCVAGQVQGGHRAVQRDGVHRLAKHVRQPEQAFEPARPLPEAEAIGQRGARQRTDYRHNATLQNIAQVSRSVGGTVNDPRVIGGLASVVLSARRAVYIRAGHGARTAVRSATRRPGAAEVPRRGNLRQ
ncbi:hypothetical protein MHPYR_200082 [uncultured Mycobacterium sp.]|uniref:Uncharacterized protein n=1 Tax=uncultured Mycobacterium sp. TaxID=171292 RepID=A0A1Y5P9A2_9MYCO|nr:hypothetical protein MHPYR_200082 [uncultured Mycobacterium sp.]